MSSQSKQKHIVIRDVAPAIDQGRFCVKRCVGDHITVSACIFRDGPEVIRARLLWSLEGTERERVPMHKVNPGLDLWEASFTLRDCGRHSYTIIAWTDHYASWVEEFRRKVMGGRTELESERKEGLMLVERCIERSSSSASNEDAALLRQAAEGLRSDKDLNALYEKLSQPALIEAMERLQEHGDLVQYEPAVPIYADRIRGRFGAWYELFPRSQGQDPNRGSSFREAEARLPDIAAMGFEVLYLPPIHPIGLTHRKGRNNTLVAQPGDPGSPWAIGNVEGGHEAVHPELGTVEDFVHYVQRAGELGMEIALDIALQCSPDHPWVKNHPEWFYHRPDGTLKYAENPPKKYEDIYPLNFDSEARAELFAALREIFELWISRGVKIFRIDNPHTKPIDFWEWLIGDIQRSHPEVLFLAEAFTRPPMMKQLAKVGFTQSYSYFTWRNGKEELRAYLEELTSSGLQEFYRPNFFANTPDILHAYLQHGGRPAFMTRLVLAATLSPTYGIYSGFELCENVPVRPGSEEYLDSEKYEIKVRDWDAPDNIKFLVRRVNEIRRHSEALQRFDNLRFLPSSNENIIFYAKSWGEELLLIAVNLDPHHWHDCTVQVPVHELGLPPHYGVEDLLTGARYTWSEHNYVRLDPSLPAHILLVHR
ncbi:MAG: alpha-1,4-glucan--maltose-1-phosphate maltosyltransferase [Myxococcota bacterium]|jgi:starch synthase (maltosyl-transferring)|nr:alpha-1,4-glucan--maltose-1-phosphate maltosyltransferase [Myxococcota bacterium]